MKNRRKPGSARSFAGTGEAPISINAETNLDKAIADSTIEKEKRIAVLEEENKKLQIQVEQKEEEEKEAELKAILTAEQLEKYKADLKETKSDLKFNKSRVKMQEGLLQDAKLTNRDSSKVQEPKKES